MQLFGITIEGCKLTTTPLGSLTRERILEINFKNTLDNSVTNALSIDVEGFVESNVQSFYIPDMYKDQSKENREIEINTDTILEVLDAVKVKATFFFVGRIARDIPQLVKKVAEAGHEIGCHSYEHVRVCDVTKEEFREKLSAAKKNLEDVSGQYVYGFRAPDFSITQDSIWALDVLQELGFFYDSSIYPFSFHDVYGIKDISPYIQKLTNGLVEFPLSTTKIFGKRFPFGGGGYFRLYPISATKLFMNEINKQGQPAIFYIHPYEVGPEIPRIFPMSRYRRFRHYYNCNIGRQRLIKLLGMFSFNTAREVLRGYYEDK